MILGLIAPHPNVCVCVCVQLDDKPIQHREVMNNESELFKSYFKEITLLEGGYVRMDVKKGRG